MTARRLTAWIAVVGVAFSALWPLASQARPAAQQVPMLVCGPGGLQAIHVDSQSPAPKSQDHREHCALCLAGIEPVAHAAPALIVLELTPARGRIAIDRIDTPRFELLLHPPSQGPPATPAA